MDMNYLFYKPKRLMKKNNVLRDKTIAYILTFALATGTCTVSTSSNDEVNQTLRKRAVDTLSNDSLDMSSSLVMYNNIRKIQNEFHDSSFDIILKNLDFSDIPIYDGTTDTSVSIARFIRNVVGNVPNDMKLDFILEHFKMCLEDFDVVQAVTCGEAKNEEIVGEGNRYEDAFAVITSIYNRMISKTKCGYAELWLHKDTPISMYDHVVAPHQYQPYGDGNYALYLGKAEGEAYQATLDALFSIALMEEGLIEENVIMHYYLDFMTSTWGYSYSVNFVPRGNEFAFLLTEKDTIPLENRFYYEETVKEEESTLSKTLY